MYQAVPAGEFRILEAYVRSIRGAQRFVYLENQFLWAPEIVDVRLHCSHIFAEPLMYFSGIVHQGLAVRLRSPAAPAWSRSTSIDRPSTCSMSSRAIASSRSTKGRHSSSRPPAASSSRSDATPPATVENADSRPQSL